MNSVSCLWDIVTAQRNWPTPTLDNRLPQSKTRDQGRGAAEWWAMDQAVTPPCYNRDNTPEWQVRFNRGDAQTQRVTDLVQSSLLVCFRLELLFSNLELRKRMCVNTQWMQWGWGFGGLAAQFSYWNSSFQCKGKREEFQTKSDFKLLIWKHFHW